MALSLPTPIPASRSGRIRRLRVVVRGAVQGVGFRPFVYHLAARLGLSGWVENAPEGALIEAEGTLPRLRTFLKLLPRELPAPAAVASLEAAWVGPSGGEGFLIRPSREAGAKTARVLPDLAVCADCLKELFDPADRRYLYPFINCTRCGPRYSIIEGIPYDRSRTTMRSFALCPDCRREYEDPADRRFHAQPIACPSCGPRLELRDGGGRALSRCDAALSGAAAALADGRVVAVKGLGGFQLLCDARRDAAVEELRRRKRRPEKPFAVMFPGLEGVKACARVGPEEERLLTSPENPIVLLRRREEDRSLAASLAPGLPTLGAFLPTTPLHALLLKRLGFPLVATSGNLSEEPLCTDETEASERLQGIADLFLVHDRPIARPLDDSVVQVVLGGPQVLRCARGYAPLPVDLGRETPPALALGGHLKSAVAVTTGRSLVLGAHVGDLEAPESRTAFEGSVESLKNLYETEPALLAADSHPGYVSTRYAVRVSRGRPVIPVQHHHAHVAACLAEHGLEGRVLGVAWDGTGHGPDDTVWGGEFLSATRQDFIRVGALRAFRLPGGEAAVREPRRAALGVLYEIFGPGLWSLRNAPPAGSFAEGEKRLLADMLARGFQSPVTTSVGRLFDAAASLLGLRQTASFEGQAAMELEAAAEADCAEFYPSALGGHRAVPRLDWEPLVRALLEDRRRGVPLGRISARFHNALVEGLVEVARGAGLERVVLSGGCFQNRMLLAGAVRRLREEGFRPFWNRRVPPNDGGLALGQALVAVSRPGKVFGG